MEDSTELFRDECGDWWDIWYSPDDGEWYADRHRLTGKEELLVSGATKADVIQEIDAVTL